MDLPKNIPMDQLINLVTILSTKLTGSTSKELKAINSNLNEKIIDAAVFVGLTKAQEGKYILTESGKKYYQADEKNKGDSIRELLKQIKIYNLSLEYLHHNKIENPTKLDIGSYWKSQFNEEIKDLNEDDLTSAIIFFLKFIEMAALGKFVGAGRGRETHIQINMVELAKYVTSGLRQSEIDIQKKKEQKDIQHDTDKTQQDENLSNSIDILKRLNPELIWSDLDSDGAKKLIIDKLNTLSNENTVLLAKVDEYQKLDGINAVLIEKVKNLKTDNLFRASVNSIGGIMLGAAITMDQLIYQVIGSILGIILISMSVFLKESNKNKEE